MQRDRVIAAMQKAAKRFGFEKLPMRQWEDIYTHITGRRVTHETTRKRRIVSGIGELVPPNVYIMTAEEFICILETPLPLCTRVIGQQFDEA